MNLFQSLAIYLLLLAALVYSCDAMADCWEPDMKIHKICYIGGFMGWCER